MKTIVYVNLGNKGSTGKIMRSLANLAESEGYKTYLAYPGKKNELSRDSDIIIGNDFFRKVNRRICMLKGKPDTMSKLATRKFLRKLDKIKPDVLHLHNVHSSFLNIKMLFNYIKKRNIKVIWTLHDCWAFTGQCSHFTMAKCDKWKSGCFSCPQYKTNFRTYVDNTKKMWQLKSKLFTGVKDMTIVTPSSWLSDLVKQSYLKEYQVKVINNGIDLSVFKPTPSDFIKEQGLENKHVVLSVAFGWGAKSKGLDVIVELSKRLPEEYKIILIGAVDEKLVPPNVTSIYRTKNQTELAEIYTVADVFINPTREENYPTVNMEALACGTPVVTFRTGGSPEMLDDTCGVVVDCDDNEAMLKEIKRVCEKDAFCQSDCLKKAKEFDENFKFREYMQLYKEGENE